MIIRESEVPWFLILLKECDFSVIQEQRESFLSFELETDIRKCMRHVVYNAVKYAKREDVNGTGH